MQRKQLSIIIINYNGKDLTLDCLESIYSRLDNVDFEIIVVDNASKDGSIEAIAEQFPQVILIKNSDNLGFSKANNQGIKIAKGKYILLLNNDTLLLEGDFEDLIQYLEANDDVGILGCRINNSDGSLQLSCYKFPGIKQMVFHNLGITKLFPDSSIFGDYRNWKHDMVREVDFVIGAFFLLKKSLMNKIGLLDEQFFLNAEETEYCLRARKAKFKTIFHPGYTIIHFGGQAKESIKEKALLAHIKGSDYLIRKHYNFAYYLFYRFLSFFTSFIRLFVIFILIIISLGKLKAKLSNEMVFRKKIIMYNCGLIK